MSNRAGIFYGRIVNGKIELEFRDSFKNRIEFLNGEKIELKLNKFRNTRTLSQNAYLWGVVYPAFEDYTGYSPEELHEAFKMKFLTDYETNPQFPRVRSTTDLDTKEFADYVDKIILLAAEMGIVVEPPPSAVEAEKNEPKKMLKSAKNGVK